MSKLLAPITTFHSSHLNSHHVEETKANRRNELQESLRMSTQSFWKRERAQQSQMAWPEDTTSHDASSATRRNFLATPEVSSQASCLTSFSHAD